MGDCLRGSSRSAPQARCATTVFSGSRDRALRARAASRSAPAWPIGLGGVLALAGGGCAPKTIVVVDPYPCPDGSATGCTPGLLNDLVGYWHLTDPAGSTVARDSSGWGNDATIVGI